jgi:hypothetical protein
MQPTRPYGFRFQILIALVGLLALPVTAHQDNKKPQSSTPPAKSGPAVSKTNNQKPTNTGGRKSVTQTGHNTQQKITSNSGTTGPSRQTGHLGNVGTNPSTRHRPIETGGHLGAHPPTYVRPNPVAGHPGRTSTTVRGHEVERDSTGKMRSVSMRNGGQVKFSHHGVRSSEAPLRNGGRVVTVGHRGFVEHPFNRNGHDYLRRTYVVHGRTYVRVYRDYRYHGFIYHRYVPGYYYRPAFYGWAWRGSFRYAWWPGPRPLWYGYYGPYFAYYPAYAAPWFWLTDYVIAANLQAAYDAGAATAPTQETGEVASGPTTAPLAFVPVYADGTRTLASGFSTAGSFQFYNDHVFLRAAATATFSFSVPVGQEQTVAYGIPTGGALSNSPLEIAVNGVTEATVTEGTGPAGASTPTQLLLWRKSFGPGDYVVTIRSGGSVNFYGLWLGEGADNTQTAANTPADTEDGQPSGNGNTDAVTLSPEVKELIAQEVKEQLAAEQAAASGQTTESNASDNQTPPALDPKQRVFIVSSDLDVTPTVKGQAGQECGLTPGDVLLRTSDDLENGNQVKVSVMSSKANDCSAGSEAYLTLDQLQEMQNSFQEQVDAGTQSLAENQGKNGLPAAPAGSTNSTENAEGQAAPDLGAAADVQAQLNAADQAQKEVSQGSGQGSASNLLPDPLHRNPIFLMTALRLREECIGGLFVARRGLVYSSRVI